MACRAGPGLLRVPGRRRMRRPCPARCGAAAGQVGRICVCPHARYRPPPSL